MDEILLTEVAEDEGFDVTNQMEITKYLKLRVTHKVSRLEFGSILFRFPS
jgi:double-strand break repair protein MRE11